MQFFKNIFLFSFLFFTFSANILFAEIVKKVTVIGNDRISLETIVIFGDITIGKDYNSSEINILIKKLYQTNFFSNISASLKENKLILTVKENPMINSIELNGEKGKSNKEKIIELLSLRENNSFIESNIKSDINLLKEFYRVQGFYFVKIDAEVQELANNRINISYDIVKGKKAKISKISFVGNKNVREKRLRDIITSQENQFWKFISRSVYLNEQRIELDKRLLKNYYRNIGYYEVDIKSTNVVYSEGEGFILTYNINSGQRYKFKKISAVVSESLDQSAFNSLQKEFSKMVGNYYSQKKLKNVLDKIDKLSEQRELQFINHNVVETLDGETVEVKINIFEGEKIIIERINIVGNSITNDSVIRSALIVDEGDPFSVLLVNKSINNIKSRNIFGKVEQKTLPGSNPDLKILEISVEEKATGEIMAGAGVGTSGTSFSFTVRESNWLGRGVSVASSLNLSTNKVSGNLIVNNPNYKLSGNALFTALDVSSTDKSSTSGFKSSRSGFEVGTSFEQYENFYIAPKINVVYEDIEVDAESTTDVKKMAGTFVNADLGYSLTVDKRNQRFKPTSGYITSFNQKLPLLQDSSSITNGINMSSYKAFSEDVVASLKFNAQAVNGTDGDVRLTNRLFIPRNKLRGFLTKQVGPKDGEDFVGGNYVSALNLEGQLPNLLPESYRTDFVIFLDAANVWGVDYKDIDDGSKIRSSIGLGANVFSTIGPLSFTLAQSITKGKTDKTETFNFRLGTAF